MCNNKFLKILDFYFGEDEDIYFLSDTYTENDKLELVTEFCIDVMESILEQKVLFFDVELKNGKRIKTLSLT